MSRWRAFVDVLDEILTDPVPAAPPPAAGRVTSTPLYAHTLPNRFWTAPGPYRPAPDGSTPRFSGAPTSAPQTGQPDWTEKAEPRARGHRPEHRQRRALDPAQESALRTLVGLGAALDCAFTSGELRSAFRALAQRYHPDRHPHASDAERMRLGATFAELAQAYGVLHETAH